MNHQQILDYYSREDVQRALLKISGNREVAGVFKTGAYSTRPNTLLHNSDIITMVKSGVIEFHGSLEHWSTPTLLKETNYDQLRIGWDIVLDFDCDLFDHGKICSEIVSKALNKFGVKNFSLKFTGGTGFHLGISWKTMPKEIDYRSTVNMFPELPRKIASFLKNFVKDDLENALLKKYSPEELAQQTNRPLGKIMSSDGINPFEIVDIDPILLSTRHLFRLPYSLNMKAFRVSLPVKPENLGEFKPEDALPEKLKAAPGNFLDSGEEGEMEILITEALDFYNKKPPKKTIERKRPEITAAIKPDIFPPCIKAISEGLADGRKRALFILLNFLKSVGWKWEDVEKFILEWNQKNKPALPESYINNQLKWHGGKSKIPPPNCPSEKSKGWYEAIGVCKPDNICGVPNILIKNPINYPIKIMDSYTKKAPPQRKGKVKKKGGIETWDTIGTI